MDVDTREDRRAALDKFAEAPPTQPNGTGIVQMHSPADRVFGAQSVAVYRDDARVLQKLAALGAAAGDDWFYRFPVKGNGGQSYIEGPSIKLANDVARIYGNCDVDCRVTDLGDSWVFHARFTDFETGYSLTRPYQQRKNQKSIKGDSDRQLDIAFQIGTSKAIRNVVVNALQTYSDYAFNAARDSLVDKIGKNLAGWLARVIDGVAKIPVDLVRVEKVIGKPSKDWLAPDVAKVIAMMKAISDGMANVDETFPAPDKSINDDTTATSNTSSPQAAGSDAQAGKSDGDQGPASADNDASQAKSAGAGAKVETSTDTKADTKTDAKPDKKGADKGEIVPDSETGYQAYANAKISQVIDPVEGRKWWAGEKSLRNKCNVSAEVRDKLKVDLDAKCAELEKE